MAKLFILMRLLTLKIAAKKPTRTWLRRVRVGFLWFVTCGGQERLGERGDFAVVLS